MKKRMISLLLMVAMMFTVFAGMSVVNVSAYSTFDALKAKYLHGTKWNSTYQNGRAIQCHGFALQLGYELSDIDPYKWTYYYDTYSYLSTGKLKSGDIIRTYNDGHTIMVTNVNGSAFNYVDFNWLGGAGNNIINWNGYCTISNGNILSIFGKANYVMSAPKDLSNNSEKPVDIGTDFYAYITNTSSWLYLANDYDNVSARKATFLSEQIWKFERQYDNSYVIKSSATGKCLDIAGASTIGGANVQTFDYNGTDAQKWLLLQRGDNKYIIRSKLGNCVLDLTDNNMSSGTNIQSYHQLETEAQFFSIHKYNTPDKPKISVKTDNSNVEVSWEAVTGATHYDVYLIQEPYNWDDVKYSKTVPFNSTYCQFKNIISGDYAAFVVSRPNNDDIQSNWEWFKTTNNILEPKAIKEYNGHTYKLYNNVMTWEQAKLECENMGGHLVTITSVEEQNIIEQLIKNQFCRWYFMGASKLDDNKIFNWITGENFVYSNWNNNATNITDTNNYLMITKNLNGKWQATNNNGYDCLVGFICEFENSTQLIGDVDCDGEITITDVTLIQKHIANMISFTEEQQKIADVTKDGKINVDDVTLIQKYVAGLAVIE